MQKLGREVPMEEIEKIISKHDRTGDGCLSFDEFKMIFFDGKELEETAGGDMPFGADGPEVAAQQ